MKLPVNQKQILKNNNTIARQETVCYCVCDLNQIIASIEEIVNGSLTEPH